MAFLIKFDLHLVHILSRLYRVTELQHPIKVAARRSGLSTHVIRIWEKRYGAVSPKRTGTNRRLYSDSDIERLMLLRAATLAGQSIGQVAKLPTSRLKALATETPDVNKAPAQLTQSSSSIKLLDQCITAVKDLDARALEVVLVRAEVALGVQGLLQRVIAPLAQKIGDLWRDGAITAAHEHFASVVIRSFLGHATRPFAGMADSPSLVIATPSGQLHELGALLVSATAANLGWRITYLGVSLPASEIAGAATQSRARAVALSIVYPEDDPKLEGELVRLRELLPAELPILTGGRAMPAYRAVLERINAIQTADLKQLASTLDALRKNSRKS